MAKKNGHRQHERKKRDNVTRLRAALLYASHGVPVVPMHGLKKGRCTCGDRQCKRPGRHARTKLDVEGATLDREEIRRMWKKWPSAKIGIVMGSPGKLIALMTDGPAGWQTLRAVAVTRGALRRTVTIRNRDRRLRLFRVDGKVPHRCEIAKGVRILGDSDLVVAPSTLTGSDSERRFATGRALGQVKIAKAPQWLFEISNTSTSDRPACKSEQQPVQSKALRLPSDDGDRNSRLVVTSALDITPKSVAWLWPERIALGKLSLIAGNPELGKSQLAASLAAIVSTGREWPCGEGRAPLGTVIMLVAEDNLGYTVVPRLEAANADLSRVHFVDASGHDLDLLSDIQALSQKISRFNDVRLIIMDPITAFVKSGNLRRAAARRLQWLAAELNAAVVVLTHLSKTIRANALMRVLGSLDLAAVARAAFIVANEQGTDRRLFLPIKNNLAAPRSGLAYRVESKIASNGTIASAVVWESAPITISADEALASTSKPTNQQPALTDAADFLHLLLSSGPVAAKEIKSEASDAGVSAASLRRAAATLGVKSRRVGGLAGAGHWIWDLPEGSAAREGGTRALARTPLGGG